MALRWVRPRAESNGSGTSYEDALNTFAGLTWGAHHYLVDGGTLRETITFGAGSNGARLFALNPLDPPIVDCEDTRASGIDLNAKVGCTVAGFMVVNQNAAPTNAGIRVSGSGHRVIGNFFRNCRVDIHVNNSAGNLIWGNGTELGNALTLTIAYHVRINGATSTGNRVGGGSIATGAALTYGTGIEVYAGQDNRVERYRITARSIDGILLRAAATGNRVISNGLYGDLKDCVALENAHGNFVHNNSVRQDGGIGSTYPCIKLGNDFGAGDPSDENEVRNNMLWSATGLPIVLNQAGPANTFNGDRIWRAAGGTIARLDLFGGATDNFRSFAQWQADGYDADGTNADADWDDQLLLHAGSDLLTAGVDLGYLRDINGRQCRRHVGAYGRAQMLVTA